MAGTLQDFRAAELDVSETVRAGYQVPGYTTEVWQGFDESGQAFSRERVVTSDAAGTPITGWSEIEVPLSLQRQEGGTSFSERVAAGNQAVADLFGGIPDVTRDVADWTGRTAGSLAGGLGSGLGQGLLGGLLQNPAGAALLLGGAYLVLQNR